MVDVDRRMPNLSPAHAAGLRRLSTRAATALTAPLSSSRNGLLPLSLAAEALVAHFRSSGVSLNPGLSVPEFARIEAEFGFTFPPDLRAVLALAIPSGPGFPDWRSIKSLQSAFDLPIAEVSLQITRGEFWPRSWGPRPTDPERALQTARSALRRAPLLVPLFNRCYVPARPALAGNPVFLVGDSQITCCAIDLANFFRREASFQLLMRPLRRQRSAGVSQKAVAPLPLIPSCRLSLDSVQGKTARWIEFWSDSAAASGRQRRISNGSSTSSLSSSPDQPWSSLSSMSSTLPPPDPELFVEIRPPKVPDWVGSYLEQIGSVLREGGWRESDVSEMVHASASGYSDGKDSIIAVDGQSLLDSLLVRAVRCTDSLRCAGWPPDEVDELLGVHFRRDHKRVRRLVVKLPPGVALKIEKLAEAVSHTGR